MDELVFGRSSYITRMALLRRSMAPGETWLRLWRRNGAVKLTDDSQLKRLAEPDNLLNPGVIINLDAGRTLPISSALTHQCRRQKSISALNAATANRNVPAAN